MYIDYITYGSSDFLKTKEKWVKIVWQNNGTIYSVLGEEDCKWLVWGVDDEYPLMLLPKNQCVVVSNKEVSVINEKYESLV